MTKIVVRTGEMAGFFSRAREAAHHARHRCFGRTARHAPAPDREVLCCVSNAGTSTPTFGYAQARNRLRFFEHTRGNGLQAEAKVPAADVAHRLKS